MEILRRLEDAISNPEPNPGRSDVEEPMDLLTMEFTMSLVEHSDFKSELSAIKYFCGVMSCISYAGGYTNFLAEIQFGIRVFSLETCLLMKERDDYDYPLKHETTGETPLLTFRGFHHQ
jgi:hypothetical protein